MRKRSGGVAHVDDHLVIQLELSPLDLPYISPISPLYLPYISTHVDDHRVVQLERVRVEVGEQLLEGGGRRLAHADGLGLGSGSGLEVTSSPRAPTTSAGLGLGLG